MSDLDQLALAMPGTSRRDDAAGRPSYYVGTGMYCCHRAPRPDAIDALTGERMDDVVMFRVESLEEKEALLSEPGSVFFTTRHFDGYAAVLVRESGLELLGVDELFERVADAWLSRAPKRAAALWLAEHAG